MYYSGFLALEDIWDREFENQWGVKVLLYMACDEQVAASSKKLTTISDFKGQKIRTFYPQLSDMVRALGASAQLIPYGEMYSALERGVVDGAVTGMGGHYNLANYEVVNYALWGIGLGGYAPNFALMPLEAWNELPSDVQKVLMDLRETASLRNCTEAAEKQGEKAAKQLADEGMTLTKASEEDIARVREIAMGEVWTKWLENVTPLGKELLDSILAAKK